MAVGKYIFDSFDTALYKKGMKAKDYMPKHGMVVLEYNDVDLVLRLIIHSPEQTRSESTFAWAMYKWNEVLGIHEIESVTEAIFDETQKVQTLPDRTKIGMQIYGMLTDL